MYTFSSKMIILFNAIIFTFIVLKLETETEFMNVIHVEGIRMRKFPFYFFSPIQVSEAAGKYEFLKTLTVGRIRISKWFMNRGENDVNTVRKILRRSLKNFFMSYSPNGGSLGKNVQVLIRLAGRIARFEHGTCWMKRINQISIRKLYTLKSWNTTQIIKKLRYLHQNSFFGQAWRPCSWKLTEEWWTTGSYFRIRALFARYFQSK